MNIILNKDISLTNFTYVKDLNTIKKCNNLIYVICDLKHLNQIEEIKKIRYSKIFIVIDIGNITINEKIECENIIKSKFININNTNLFTINKIYNWNLILDIIYKNLKKDTTKINYYKSSIYIIIIIMIFIPIYMFNVKNAQLEQVNIYIKSIKNITNIIINELNDENAKLKCKLEKYEKDNEYLKNVLNDISNKLEIYEKGNEYYNNNIKQYYELKEQQNINTQLLNICNIKNETLIKNID